MLNDNLKFYFYAYLELQSECQIGMAKGRVPWYSIVRYANHYGIYDPDNIETTIRHIRAMEYIQDKHESKKRG